MNPSKNRLAIVIPAFKATFFKSSLESISRQTCKDFTVYVGDDCSPYNLFEIVKLFDSEINIVYKRFDSNLGSKDLIGQWNRCLELVQDEEWIWFFSDDDIMERNCVELFYHAVSNFEDEVLIHFNIDIIDSESRTINSGLPFPERLSSRDFFMKKILGHIDSYVVEFIFKKEHFYCNGGFQKFDLAWCSDDATWIKLASSKGILTIGGAKVLWRYSGQNISSISDDRGVVLRKFNAVNDYFVWVAWFFKTCHFRDISSFSKLRWVIIQLKSISALSFKEKFVIVRNQLRNLNVGAQRYLIYLYFFYQVINYSITNIGNNR